MSGTWKSKTILHEVYQSFKLMAGQFLHSVGELLTCLTNSPEDLERAQSQDLITIKEELRVGKGCQIFRFEDSVADSEPHGVGRGTALFSPDC